MSENYDNLPRSTRIIYRVFDALARVKRRWFVTTIIAVCAVSYFGNGFYVVGKEQEAVETRFGKVVKERIGPGLHFCFPIIERTYVRNVKRIIRNTLSSAEGGEKRFTLLSGDTNLMEISISIQYQITDLKKFLFLSADPDSILMAMLRSRLIDAVSTFSIDLILTSNRDVIEQSLEEGVSVLLHEYDIGITPVELSILDVNPIAETIPAFRDVTDAIAEKAQRQTEAHTKGERLLAHARGQASAMVRNAEARALERVQKAQSAASVFNDLLAEYRTGKAEVTTTRYWTRVQNIFREASLAAINPNDFSTIDINMMDTAAAIPGVVGSGQAGMNGEAVTRSERPIYSTVRSDESHTIERNFNENWLIEGRYHESPIERDHASFANSRSLIFDHPSMFTHTHVKRSGTVEKALSQQTPMLVQFADQPTLDAPPSSVEAPKVERTVELENQSESTDP